MGRVVCLAVGYFCGSFLTGELVVRARTGRGAGALGSGNPGMANVAGQLGIGWGLLVLAGDAGKTALACGIGALLFYKDIGPLALLYAGLGAVIGHNFSFWKRFHGGKGVAATCTALILFSPLWGSICCIAGGLAALLSKDLALGAVAIPTLFLVPVLLFYRGEAVFLVFALLFLMLWKNVRWNRQK